LTFGYLTYGSEAELVVPPMVDCYHLNLTMEGRTLVHQGCARVLTCAGASGVLLSPQQESTLEWSADARQFAVKIPVVSLQAQLSSLLHEPVAPPQIALRVDLASDIGRGLLGAASFLAGQFDTGEVAELVRDQLESYLLTQILMATEHADSARLRSGGATGRLALDEALDYIESYPERALGIAELAAVAGAPAAALQAAFEQDLGMTAEQYVREARLTRAHAELEQGRPGESIESIASRWGFGSAKRFRAEYRARYGHSPGGARTRVARRG
jgi:AraC-like DNA-binding protein